MKFIISIIFIVVVAFIYYRKITSQKKITRPYKLTGDLIGDKLAYIFLGLWKTPADIRKLKDEFSIMATNEEIYLCLSSLFFLGFLMATKSKNVKIAPTIIERISQRFVHSLVSKYSIFHDMYKDANNLLEKQDKTIDQLVKIWDESLNKEPSPFWFVGKELCYILNGRDETPSPALIALFTQFMSKDAVLIKDFLVELEKDFTITENE